MRKGLSEKELKVISELELNNKYFFTLDEVRKFFKSKNERNVYIHKLRKKGRIVKINKSKYFLVPIKAVGNNWSEHPFILIDEIMNGKKYCIAGKAAAHYWHLTEQIPSVFEVWNTKIHGKRKMLNTTFLFKKRKINEFPKNIVKKIYKHTFIIATKKESLRWKQL